MKTYFLNIKVLKQKRIANAKYRKKDCKCNDIIYAIENLANNQLFFRRPGKFNDPYDSRTYWCLNGKKEKHINHLMLFYGLTQEESEHYIDDAIAHGKMTKTGDLICYDPIMEIDLGLPEYSRKDLHGYSQKESLPKVCCFSGKDDNILMWSHYADSHQGICLRFRSIKDWEDLELGKYFLYFDYSKHSFQSKLARKNPLNDQFYRKKFLKVNYKHKDETCPKVNYLDADSDLKMTKCLLEKFIDWNYEDEYRMIITHYNVIDGLFSSDEFENGLLKYQKEALEGIVFGMKITYKNAKLVCDTVKKNYLDEGITVKLLLKLKKFIVNLK